MSDPITAFFAAWPIEDAAARTAQIMDALGSDVFYADPRTPEPLITAEAVAGYVGQFSQMAPGMPVAVVATAKTLGFTRATVQFGAGEQAQLGQYTIEQDDTGRITRMIGFVGLGAPA